MKKLAIILGCLLASSAAFADIVLQPGQSTDITADMVVMSFNNLRVHCAAPQVYAPAPGMYPAPGYPAHQHSKPLYSIRSLGNFANDYGIFNEDNGQLIEKFSFKHQAEDALRGFIRNGQCRNK